MAPIDPDPGMLGLLQVQSPVSRLNVKPCVKTDIYQPTMMSLDECPYFDTSASLHIVLDIGSIGHCTADVTAVLLVAKVAIEALHDIVRPLEKILLGILLRYSRQSMG